MGYKGSLEPTAAATVWQKLADTMGKVRIPFLKKKNPVPFVLLHTCMDYSSKTSDAEPLHVWYF